MPRIHPMPLDDPLPQKQKPDEDFEDHYEDDPAEDDEEEDPEEDPAEDDEEDPEEDSAEGDEEDPEEDPAEDEEEDDPEEDDPEEDDPEEDDPEEDDPEEDDSRPQKSQHKCTTTTPTLLEKDLDEDMCEGESETYSGSVTRLDSHSAHEHVSLASPMPLKLKRPAETSKNSKFKKVKTENATSHGVATKKKSAFTRLFSKEDEITILNGIILFAETEGIDPNSDSTAFHKFLKTNISVDVSKDQLMDKISRLKTKFKKNAEKGDETGFSKSHDSEIYELSKEIWGGNEVVKEKEKPVEDGTLVIVTALAAANQNFPHAVKRDQEKTKVIDANQEENKNDQGEFSTLYPFTTASLKMKDNLPAFLGSSMESCLILTKKSKLEELEKEWKKLMLDEIELQLRRSALLQKQIEAAIDACLGRG